MKARLQHDHDAGKSREDGGNQRPGRALVLENRQDPEVGRHEERRRVDERHVRAEGQLAERVEPERHRDRAEDGALDVAPEVRRSDVAACFEHKKPDREHAEDRTVEDELQAAELCAAELDERGHQREEKRGGERPE